MLGCCRPAVTTSAGIGASIIRQARRRASSRQASPTTMLPSDTPKAPIRCRSSLPVRMPFGSDWFNSASSSIVTITSLVRYGMTLLSSRGVPFTSKALLGEGSVPTGM